MDCDSVRLQLSIAGFSSMCSCSSMRHPSVLTNRWLARIVCYCPSSQGRQLYAQFRMDDLNFSPAVSQVEGTMDTSGSSKICLLHIFNRDGCFKDLAAVWTRTLHCVGAVPFVYWARVRPTRFKGVQHVTSARNGWCGRLCNTCVWN